MVTFDKKSYIEKRKKYKLYGATAVFIALLDLVDSGYPFPIPLTGTIAVYVSILILVPGLVIAIMGFKPPSARTIEQVAKSTNGYILATFLVEYLDISTRMAEVRIFDLFTEGYLDVVNKIDDNTPVAQWVCKFVGVTQGSGATNGQPGVRRTDPNFSLAEHTQNNPELSVSDINNMLLSGSMNLGASGQPA